MRPLFLFAGLFLTAFSPTYTGGQKLTEPPGKPKLPDGTPAQQVQALSEHFDNAMAALMKKYNAAESDAEQVKLLAFVPDRDAYAALFVQIAEKHPKEPAALDALIWVVRHTREMRIKTDTPFARAKRVLVRDYLRHPKVGALCLALRYDELNTKAIEIIRQVLDKNPDKSAQAQAAYALTSLLGRRASSAEYFTKTADPKIVASFEQAYGKEAVADVRRADPEALKKERLALLERLTRDKEYAATLIAYGEKRLALGELADRELFELRSLQPGCPAPEIVGEDVEGKPMNLSDFRGKVVLLDFWGHW
jgi:hypothetical protein